MKMIMQSLIRNNVRTTLYVVQVRSKNYYHLKSKVLNRNMKVLEDTTCQEDDCLAEKEQTVL